MIVAHKEIKKISKEQLGSVSFSTSAGYFSDGELRERHRRFHLSILLANHAEADIKIVFNTVAGYRELTTAIWGATDKYILLKGGSFIPVEAVAFVYLNQQT